MGNARRADVAGRPGYCVTEDGRVFGPKGQLKVHMTPTGYLHVTLGYGRTSRVHRLVAAAFVPNQSNAPEVNHIDGNKLNNAASNLEWCTRKQNMAHAFATGLCRVVSGEGAPAAKLKDSDVAAIKAAFVKRHPEFGGAALARRYGVDQSRIHQIVRGG